MEENRVIDTSFTNWLDKFVVVKDKNGNLIPLNNWNSKGPNSISLDWKDVIAQARINEALDNLKNRGLIQTF